MKRILYGREIINKYDGRYFYVNVKLINLEFNLGMNKICLYVCICFNLI